MRRFRGTRAPVSVCVALVGLALATWDLPLCMGADSSESASNEPSLIVMDNGMVMKGIISATGQTYTISKPGGKIVIPMDKVRFRCDTLEEAYTRLRDTLTDQKTAASHIELAKWCLKYQLFAEARTELTQALELEPDREEARQIIRRLDELMGTGRDSTPQRPPARKRFSLDESERADIETLGGLSRNSALQFTRRIQPILLNNCANANCHGRITDNEFKLAIISPGQGTQRHLVERNLEMVLRYVDTDDPNASPLLTVPRGKHGARGKPLFQGPKGAEQAEALQQWVEGLRREKNVATSPGAKVESANDSNATGSSAPEVGAAEPSVKKPAPSAQVPNADDEHPLLKVMKSTKSSTSEIVRAGAEQPPPAVTTKPKPLPVPQTKLPRPQTKSAQRSTAAPDEAIAPADEEPDPFDPEIFNRQTRRRQRPR